MLPWIDQHSSSLTVIASFGTLAVWVFYAQILLNNVLQQRRPRVLINVGKGRDIDAEIIVANMSQDKIFIQLLLAVVRDDDGEFTRAITDVKIYDDDDTERVTERATSQGPLSPGSYLRLGSFRHVAQQVSPGAREQAPWQTLEVRLIFFYGSTSTVVAASRTFQFIERDTGKRYVSPATPDTTLLHRIWHRRTVRRWLLEHG